MDLFEYDDYKKWLNDSIEGMPKRGRGQYRRIAERLNTSATIVTQVFKGNRDLTLEQAVLLSEYFGLPNQERRFLLLLVSYSRAGTHRYKQILKEEILELRMTSREIKNRVSQSHELTSEVKSELYSNWYYIAAWSLTAIEGSNDLDSICAHLKISRKRAREAIDFLLKHGMIVEKDGKLRNGPTLIHLEADSPLTIRHHQNWRLRAFERYEDPKSDDAFYTAPVTLSKSDAKKMRARVLKFISESVELIKDSPSEKLYCFCLDWFET